MGGTKVISEMPPKSARSSNLNLPDGFFGALGGEAWRRCGCEGVDELARGGEEGVGDVGCGFDASEVGGWLRFL